MTDIKVLQANQIGGCITIISTDITKIVIDFGESLPGSGEASNIEFDWALERVDAVFFTHYHGDHIGRFMEIPDDVHLYMGKVTWEVLKNINEALGNKEVVEKLDNRPNIHFVEINHCITVGDMKITPYSVDHSAFDAYMFLVETPDKNILHTGDYRDHGHRGHKKDGDKDINVMLEVIRCYVKQFGKRKIDVLITEGTMMGIRQKDKRYSEKMMLEDAKQFFKEQKYIFLKISSTNVDSLATFYHAAKHNGMGFYGNKYVLKQLETFSREGKKYTDFYAFDEVWPILPKPSDNASESYLRSYRGQRSHMINEGFVMLVSEHEYYEEIMDEFEELNPVLIYSMWSGYINKEIGGNAYQEKLANFCNKYGYKELHTSGHAFPGMINAVIETVYAQEIIPIHTENAAAFMEL